MDHPTSPHPSVGDRSVFTPDSLGLSMSNADVPLMYISSDQPGIIVEQPFQDIHVVDKALKRKPCSLLAVIGLACCVGILAFIAGASTSAAIIIPLSNSDSDGQHEVHNVSIGDSLEPAPTINHQVNASNSTVVSTSDSVPFVLVGRQPICDFACMPSAPWCPRGAICECEPCAVDSQRTALAAASDGVAYMMKVYAHTEEATSISTSLPCHIVDPVTLKSTNPNCQTIYDDDSVVNETAVAISFDVESADTVAKDKDNFANRIEGGGNIGIATARHQVLYTTSDGYLCGGSILSDEFVITAGHCCANRPVANCGSRIMFGSANILQYRGGGGACDTEATAANHRCVEEMTIHPQYNPSTLQYDVCMLRLSKPLPAGGNWEAVTVAEFLPAENTVAFASGWGKDRTDGSIQTTLKGVELLVKSAATLRRSYGPAISDGHIGGHASGKGICQGDSGGPFVVKVDNEWQLIGVTSFSEASDCSHASAPSGFWRPQYGSFVANTMAISSPCNPGQSCNAPTADSAGCGNTPDGGFCSPTCEVGFTLVGSTSSIQCNDGSWSGSFQCMQKCTNPSVPYSRGCSSIEHGGLCTPACTDDREPTSSAPLLCIDGAYDDAAFECIETTCTAPSIAGFSCAESAPHADGSTCTPTCSGSSIPSSTTPLMCVNGAFEGPAVTCLAACDDEPSDSLSRASDCAGTPHGGTCTPSCRGSAYVGLPSDAVLTCNDGKWEGEFDCKDERCSRLSGRGGRTCVEGDGPFYPGDVCTPACRSGYAPLEASYLRCGAEEIGQWSGPSFSCGRICAGTPSVSGVADATGCAGLVEGATCKPTCPSDTAVFVGEFECERDGSWSGAGQCEETVCKEENIPNGSCIDSQDVFNIDDRCKLQCDPGYTRESGVFLKCGSSEEWVGRAECVPSACSIGLLCGSDQAPLLGNGERCAVGVCPAGQVGTVVECANGALTLLGDGVCRPE